MAKFLSLKDAVAENLHDGDVAAFEGFTHLIPHAAAHEAIRQGRKDLTLIRMTPDLVYDQMIGMGMARKLVFSYAGNPGVGLLPVAVLLLILGPDHVLSEIAQFFSQMAVVTFGGAYAVLAYVAQEAVQGYGWLRPGEMLDGLALAETTPGPLILVLQFVGFLGAYHAPGGLAPWLAGLFASLLTLWVTFAPCFLWIFLGAPYVERVRAVPTLNGALAAITAAVVGVILNLALWFALHSIFRELRLWEVGPLSLSLPVGASIDWLALALTAAALVAMLRFKTGMIVTLASAALLGGLLHALR